MQGNEVHTHTGALIRLFKNDEVLGDRIISFYCRNCGFSKLHKEIKEKKE
jgi:hypothetical protein